MTYRHGGDGGRAEVLDRLASHERALWIVLAVALAGDAGLTWYGLQHGLTEANPVMRAAMAWVGVVVGILVVKTAAMLVALLAHRRLSRHLRPVVPAAMALPWLAAAAVNGVGILLV
jgi:hypothetical protein